MEWRIFFPRLSSPDVWSLLDARKGYSFFKPHSSERTDVYLGCTEGVGLKVRGAKNLLEIKVRGVVQECGAEDWYKLAAVHYKSLAVDSEELQQAFLQELQEIQTKIHLDKECTASLSEALSSSWSNQLVSVSKQVTKDSIGGVSVEQCDLTVTTGTQHAPTHWRSVCLESHSLSKIEQLLSKETKPDPKKISAKFGEYLRAIPGSIVQGYPSFILARALE